MHHVPSLWFKWTFSHAAALMRDGGRSAFDRNDENMLIVRAPNFADAIIREAMRCWRADPYAVTKWRTILPETMKSQ